MMSKNDYGQTRSFNLGIAQEFDIATALLYDELSFWYGKGKRPDEWIYKTYQDLQERLPLSEYQIRQGYKNLEDAGWLEKKIMKANGSPTVHYRILKKLVLVTEKNSETIDTEKTSETLTATNTATTTIVTNVTTVQPSADTELVYEPIDEFAIKPKKTKQRNRFGNQEVQGIMDLFEDRLGVTLPDADNQRRYAKHLITKFGYAQARAMVSLVLNNQKDKYFAHVATPQDLWYKYPKIKNYIDNYDARNNHGGVTKI